MELFINACHQIFDCNENIVKHFKKEKAVIKRMVQKRGLRKNQVIFLGLLVLFFAAGEVPAAQKAPSRFQEVAGSNGYSVERVYMYGDQVAVRYKSSQPASLNSFNSKSLRSSGSSFRAIP